ncbi:MAG: hypothetical protein ACYDAA_10440 [Syntrophales bacterium]
MNFYSSFMRNQNDTYRIAAIERLTVKIESNEYVVKPSAPLNVKTAKWLLAVDFTAKYENLESRLHALERMSPDGKGKQVQFIPIRLILANKLTKDDKLALAFDALVLSEMLRREVSHGVLSIFLCKIFIGQFFEERQVLPHFSYRV